MLDRKQLFEAHWDVIKITDAVFGETFKSGSVHINGEGNDLDIVSIWSPAIQDNLINAGFMVEINDGYEDQKLTSFRRGCVNVITVFDRAEFNRFRYATDLCWTLREEFGKNLTKDLRVFLHEYIRNTPL